MNKHWGGGGVVQKEQKSVTYSLNGPKRFSAPEIKIKLKRKLSVSHHTENQISKFTKSSLTGPHKRH
jgi:hypothetical protein